MMSEALLSRFWNATGVRTGALGPGSAMQQPLAVAIVAGLVVQMPLVLIVMPALFKLLRGAPAPPA